MLSQEVPPIHTFSQVGTYTIDLTVTDNTGLTDFTQKQIRVLAAEEIPEITNPNKKPIANTKIFILDSQQNIVPIGISGELHIGDVGLARQCH